MASEHMTLEKIAELIIPIVSEYDVDRVFIFGSYARGDANGDSDIDIGVVAPHTDTLKLGAMAYRIEEALRTDVDLIPMDMMLPQFLRSIEKDVVTIYEK